MGEGEGTILITTRRKYAWNHPEKHERRQETCQQDRSNTCPEEPSSQSIISKANPQNESPQDSYGFAPSDYSTPSGITVIDLPLSKGHGSIFAITNNDCSKAAILLPNKETIKALGIATLFREQAIPSTGILQKVITNRDACLLSPLFKGLNGQSEAESANSSAYAEKQSKEMNQSVETTLRTPGNYQQNNLAKWLSLVQCRPDRPGWETGNMSNSEPYRHRPPHQIEGDGCSEARKPKENRNAPRLLKASHKQDPLAIGTLETQKGNCATSQFGSETGRHIQEQETPPPKSKRHPELKQHPLTSPDGSTYQRSQEKTMGTLELGDNNSAQNARILRPRDNEEKPEIPPMNRKRQDKHSSTIERIAQQTAGFMPKLRATLQSRLKEIRATRTKNQSSQNCKCSVCKRAKRTEQITETDNADAQPIMVRSIRIIQEEDKALSGTSRSEAQPKRSPQSASEEMTLARELTPRLPLIEDRDSPNSSMSREPMQLKTDKNPRNQRVQATGRLPHLASYCTHHPRLSKLMHGSPSDRQ
jgi:hypothetical protein